MQDVVGVEKNTTVGSGSYAYKGVKDKDVKDVFKPAFIKAGLTILPIEINDTVQIDRWEETYNRSTKQKQSVFTTVKVKYLLLHESGESVEVVGYGHGADAMDKSAGKATTYALKNCLLYTFLTPVGAMDDTDSHHSEEIVTRLTKTPDVETWEEAIKKLGQSINPESLEAEYRKLPSHLKKSDNVISYCKSRKKELRLTEDMGEIK